MPKRASSSPQLRVAVVAFAAALVQVGPAPSGHAQPTPAASDPAAPAAPAAAQAPAPAVPAPAPVLTVRRVQFRGNRKVEDDALRVNLRTGDGVTLTQDVLRDDVRAIWRMGFFEDVQVEATNVPGNQVDVVFVVKEKPSIRKIYVSGHEELGLTKVNEVLDLKKEQILDLAKVKKNAEKIREQYIQRGFYMADVTYELKVEGGEVDVTFRVRENAKVEVRRINFVGNKSASDAELRAVMLTQEADLFSFVTSAGTYREDMFQRDVLALQAYYHDRGHVNVKIGEPRLELSADRRALFITISVEEGDQFRIGTIEVKGDLIQPREQLLERIRSKGGEHFSRTKLTQDRQALEDVYKDKGFAFVNVSPLHTADPEKKLINFVFEIEQGKEVYIDRIAVRGNTKTRDKVIRREVHIREGELYNQSQIDRSKREVNQLGYFDRVDLSTENRGDDRMDVNVEVTERQTGAFQVGAGFSSVESFIFQAQVSQENLLGRGQSLSLQAMLSGLRQIFLLQFTDPYFLDTRWTFGFTLFNQFQYYPSFDRTSKGGSLTWGYKLMDDLHLYLRYQLEEVDVRSSNRTRFLSGGQRTPFPAGTLANLLRPGFTSSVRLSLAYDSRDHRLFPKSGWYNTASAEIADDFLLSQTRFTRYDLSLRYFYPVWGPFVLRLKQQTGLITSRDPQGVPIFERYFVGGIYDVRGFRPYSLGPKIRAPGEQTPDALLGDRVIGGNLEILGRAEVEFPIIEKVGIRGVLFTDAGNSYNLEEQYCRLRPYAAHPSQDPCIQVFPLTSLRTSWGFGFRWFSPIGPLRFEWGFPFTPLRGEESVIFEFTIDNGL
jgi:outer membrane protein insertion porin family